MSRKRNKNSNKKNGALQSQSNRIHTFFSRVNLLGWFMVRSYSLRQNFDRRLDSDEWQLYDLFPSHLHLVILPLMPYGSYLTLNNALIRAVFIYQFIRSLVISLYHVSKLKTKSRINQLEQDLLRPQKIQMQFYTFENRPVIIITTYDITFGWLKNLRALQSKTLVELFRAALNNARINIMIANIMSRRQMKKMTSEVDTKKI